MNDLRTVGYSRCEEASVRLGEGRELKEKWESDERLALRKGAI
jgi:hypothetical protein